MKRYLGIFILTVIVGLSGCTSETVQTLKRYEIRAPCVMEMWITGYSAMENAIHSTWKSKGQLSHVLQTAFPTAP